MQQVAREVIDIDKHRIETAAGVAGIESIRGMRHREEVAMDEAAARIAGQLLSKRQQALFVPLDASASTTIKDRTLRFSRTVRAV
jgi:hypothetical protein